MGNHLKDCTIYAVDFDGTLCESKFPDIGEPNRKLIDYLIKKQESGDKIILWTNRVGGLLKNAVEWSAEKGLVFDAVNDNLPETVERYKDVLNGELPSRKITADIFIDDAACSEGLPFKSPKCPTKDCWRSDCPERICRK